MKLAGLGILISGASRGLGKAIAQACLAEGASVSICARSAEALEAARKELARMADGNRQLHAHKADVSDPKQVDTWVHAAQESLARIDGLVNNAGIYGPKGLIDEVSLAEWIRAVEINLLGTVLPCRKVLPIFRRQGRGKIVNLSGGGATAPLPRLSAYAASKAAVVRFTETLAEECRGSGIDVNAIAPGPLNTRLLDEVLEAGPEKVGADFYARSVKQKEEGGVPLEKGADLCVFLLSSQSVGITGRLISALWDPWTSLPSRLEQLASSDVYTLRRIVPRDRGLDWPEK
jgi:3-oxoacyl-[acyl-carrier protein] reductase